MWKAIIGMALLAINIYGGILEHPPLYETQYLHTNTYTWNELYYIIVFICVVKQSNSAWNEWTIDSCCISDKQEVCVHVYVCAVFSLDLLTLHITIVNSFYI